MNGILLRHVSNYYAGTSRRLYFQAHARARGLMRPLRLRCSPAYLALRSQLGGDSGTFSPIAIVFAHRG